MYGMCHVPSCSCSKDRRVCWPVPFCITLRFSLASFIKGTCTQHMVTCHGFLVWQQEHSFFIEWEERYIYIFICFQYNILTQKITCSMLQSVQKLLHFYNALFIMLLTSNKAYIIFINKIKVYKYYNWTILAIYLHLRYFCQCYFYHKWIISTICHFQ